MTREAKIGMLTGLGVIVLIGVLLSTYLGDGKGAGAGLMASRMAPLPVGESFRQQVMQPVGVPAMTPGGFRVKQADGIEVLTPVDTTIATAAQAEPVANELPSGMGPVMAPSVAPVPAGPVAIGHTMAGAPPTIEMPERTMDVALKEKPATGAPKAPTALTHTVVSGDNLAKIAKRYYNSAKNSDVARIVKANTRLLKDEKTPLMVNMKLTIPVVTPPAAAAAPSAPPVLEGVMVMPAASLAAVPVLDPNRKVERPGSLKDTGVVPAPVPVAKSATPAAATSKVYEVKSGDTLEKIARRIAPGRVSETMQKLISLNGIKKADSLQVGTKLKLPG